MIEHMTPEQMKRAALRAMSEKEWQQEVISLAHSWGWAAVHFAVARTASGWRTPCRADGKGWVDLVLVLDCVLHIECKTETGKLTPDQEEWRDRLLKAGAKWYLWRPSDIDEIIRVLGRKGE